MSKFSTGSSPSYHAEIVPCTILLNSDYLIIDANKNALTNIFKKTRKDIHHRSVLDLLAEKNIDVESLKDALEYSENLTSYEIRLHDPQTKKKYDTTITCINLKNKYFLITLKETASGTYDSLKAYMDAIINNLPGAVYWKDPQGHYIGCNKHVARMAGYENVQDMIGKTDHDLCWKEFANDWQALDQEVMRTGKTMAREEKAKLADGKIITELTFKTPLRDEFNQIVGIIGTSLDISEKKQLEDQLIVSKEKAENANKAKTEFLYNVRHDIRTPFSGLLSLSLLLEEGETNLQKKEYLHDIAQSAQELLNYLNEILEYMELEDSTVPVLYKPFEIRTLVGEIVTVMTPAVKYKFVKIESHIEPKIPSQIIGDQYRVHRILLNLVGNAVKFTKEGSVVIGVDIAKKEDHKFLLKIWVKDTGIGIPEEKYNLIFERFNRLTASYSGVYKGTGLGLWAVKRLIDELGGQILVTSQPGKGSLFTCIIPFECLLTE